MQGNLKMTLQAALLLVGAAEALAPKAIAIRWQELLHQWTAAAQELHR